MDIQDNVFYQQYCDDSIPPEDYHSELWASERRLMQIDGQIELQADSDRERDELQAGEPLDFN